MTRRRRPRREQDGVDDKLSLLEDELAKLHARMQGGNVK